MNHKELMDSVYGKLCEHGEYLDVDCGRCLRTALTASQEREKKVVRMLFNARAALLHISEKAADCHDYGNNNKDTLIEIKLFSAIEGAKAYYMPALTPKGESR